MSTSSNSKKSKQQYRRLPKNRSSSKAHKLNTSEAQSAIQHGSGSFEVTSSSQTKSPLNYFTEDPLLWDDSQKSFEADLASEHQHVLEYIKGTYHEADELTVSRGSGTLGQPRYRPELKITRAEYDALPGPDRLRFINARDKLLDHDMEVRNKAWSKIWSWTSRSQLLRDAINEFVDTCDSIQAYKAIKNIRLVTPHHATEVQDTQYNYPTRSYNTTDGDMHTYSRYS